MWIHVINLAARQSQGFDANGDFGATDNPAAFLGMQDYALNVAFNRYNDLPIDRNRAGRP